MQPQSKAANNLKEINERCPTLDSVYIEGGASIF
jgi:hypothetical protein